MRTVQMTLDDDLVQDVDIVAKELRLTRSAFTRKALKQAIRVYHIRKLEQKHRQGYELHPSNYEEFGVWEDEQDWGDQ